MLLALMLLAQSAFASESRSLSDVFYWVLNPDECGAAFRPQLKQDSNYWKLLDLRNEYRRALTAHLEKAGHPLNRQTNWRISRYLNTVLTLSGEATVQWRKAERHPSRKALPYAGVYNPISQQIEWRLAEYSEGVVRPYAGVFNLTTNHVEWKQAEVRGDVAVPFAGVFNPISGEVEWKQAEVVYTPLGIFLGPPSYALPYTGVFNPVSGLTEWKVAKDYTDFRGWHFVRPYAGAFNPATRQVEWQVAEIGATQAIPYTFVFNPTSEKVEWKRADSVDEEYPLPYTGVLKPFGGAEKP